MSMCILWLLVGHVTAAMTTDFEEIYIAHDAPTICPTSYKPDESYIACCGDSILRATLTTGMGPGHTPMYACCMEGDSCTGAISLMVDWSYDDNGEVPELSIAIPL